MSIAGPDLLKQIAAHYDVLTLLGEGGMGAVYRIRHRHLDEIRVAKIMHSNLRSDSHLVERFRREARLLSGLKHPNIAQIYEFFVSETGEAAIIMEWVPGEDLRRLCRRLGSIPLSLGLEVGRQTLSALEHLHSQNYVHRDISPDNLMLSWADLGDRSGPQVKMIDLGIAKALDEAGMTATGNFLGKVRYSSPERLQPEGKLDPRSDLYSLSVVLCEILTGACPIRGTSPESLISGHLFNPPKPFDELDPQGEVPDSVRELLMRMLAKKPEQRAESTAALLRDWRRAQEPFPVDPEMSGAWANRLKLGAQEDAEARDDDETLSILLTAPPAGNEADPGGTALLNTVSPVLQPGRHGGLERSLIWGGGFLTLVLLALLVWWLAAGPRDDRAALPSTPPSTIEPHSASASDEPTDPTTADSGTEAPIAENPAASTAETEPSEADAPAPASNRGPDVPPSPGTLLLTATPWAEVVNIVGSNGRVDGLPAGRSTPLAVNLLPGAYQVELSHEGLGQTRRISVEVQSDSVTRREVLLEEVDGDALLRSLGW